MPHDLTSPFTGLFSRWGPIERRPHDPAVSCWAGLLPRWDAGGNDLAVGGAGWTDAQAELSALGEAVERWHSRPLAGDGIIEASYANWPFSERAIEPERWVLFSREQYAREGFPFAPLSRDTGCRWVCCREAETGMPVWVPAAMVYLHGGSSGREAVSIAPALSTGLSAGRIGDPVLLRGLQEVLERDALVGGWWGRYPVREHDPERVWSSLPPDIPKRVIRPNLRWRFYRIDTAMSSHVTMAALAGADREGFCFSVGSACRGTRRESWLKSILEAVQSRHYVRYLRRTPLAQTLVANLPGDFAGHALYYSIHPDRLRSTPLENASTEDEREDREEGFAQLRDRLGQDRPILFRILTPPALAREWVVLRVLVPGTQPLHGHHAFPMLGGQLSPHRLAEWEAMPPHPFP